MTGNELFAVVLGAGASHVAGKSTERVIARYGLLLTAAGLVGVWWFHRRATQKAPPAGGLAIP